MLIKSFKAPTLKEAMANVKAELGVDAVILHTNKTKKGGILGFHSKEIVEVIAAVEDEPKTQPTPPAKPQADNEAVLQAAAAARNSRAAVADTQPSPASAAAPGSNYTPRTAVNQYQTAGTMAGISQAMANSTPSETFGEVLASVNHIQEQAAARSATEMPLTELAEELSASIGTSVDVGGEVIATAKPEIPEQVQAAVTPPNESAPASSHEHEESESQDKDEEIQDLQNQLEEMKSMLAQMSTNKDTASKVETLQTALQQQEVTDKVIQDMISKLNGAEILAPKNSVKALKALEKFIKKTIRMANGITLYSDRPRVVALIGPTGVGKTTTLAKIAAKFVLEQGAKVALITADTYRISAVEQLKTYSDILGLPLEIVYNPDALRQAIAKHRDKQLILIDTAGRSQYNEYQMQELSGLLAIDEDIEKHLVMSATTKTSDGVELLENFSICHPDRVIFTKVDETSTHGIILNILNRRKVALSYMTNGQSVPDDIEPASVERLAELLLR